MIDGSAGEVRPSRFAEGRDTGAHNDSSGVETGVLITALCIQLLLLNKSVEVEHTREPQALL